MTVPGKPRTYSHLINAYFTYVVLIYMWSHMPRLHVAEDQVTTGPGIFFLHSSHFNYMFPTPCITGFKPPSGIEFCLINGLIIEIKFSQ